MKNGSNSSTDFSPCTRRNSPTADEVALAIVEAAKVHGDDPIAIAQGTAGRGRVLAYCALTEVFPETTKSHIARWCGFRSQAAAAATVSMARKASWWSEEAIDEIVGLLVADEYDPDEEPDAEPAAASVVPAAPSARILPFASMHFDREERQLIARMWNGGANPAAIGAAIGADADQIRMFARNNPQLCTRQGSGE